MTAVGNEIKIFNEALVDVLRGPGDVATVSPKMAREGHGGPAYDPLGVAACLPTLAHRTRSGTVRSCPGLK